MTALLIVETVLLAVLTVLVAGLLRAYGTVLRRLHAIDGGSRGAQQFTVDTAPRTQVEPRSEWTEAHDVLGESPTGETVTARVVGAEHDSVLLFLSSGCESCAVFWDELRSAPRLADGTRLLVVTQGDDVEGRADIAALSTPDVDVVMSSAAWRDYEVPGSPHVVFVDGPTGRVRGEGTGQSWQQVMHLLERAGGVGRVRSDKPDRDAQVEAEVDRELMAAGILPGDPRLYGDR